MPFLGMHAAQPHGSPGAAAPGAFWELYCGEKSPAGGRQTNIASMLSQTESGPRFHRRGAHRASAWLRRQSALAEQTRLWRVRADVARKGALPVADAATAAVGQPLALAGRNAGREGLAATRIIGPYESERYKWPSATTVPFARGRCAARAAI